MIIVHGLPLDEANIIPLWMFSMLFLDFKAQEPRRIPTSPTVALRGVFRAYNETNINYQIRDILILVRYCNIYVLVRIWCLYSY